MIFHESEGCARLFKHIKDQTEASQRPNPLLSSRLSSKMRMRFARSYSSGASL